MRRAGRPEPLGDWNKVEGAGARPRRRRRRRRVERARHPAGRSGVPAGLITAGTDGTQRSNAKWRIDGDRAGLTGALTSGAILAPRPTPAGLLPGGLERLTGAEGTSRRRDSSEEQRDGELARRVPQGRGCYALRAVD
jgi:hypothetical protein